jgi:phage terminase small subunit
MALTEKQRTFARLIAQNTPPIEAYRASYNSTTPNDASVKAAAWKEQKKPEVAAYINELRAKQTEVMALNDAKTTEYIKTLLLERIEVCKNTGNETAIAKYCDILNKMLGNYKYTDSTQEEINELKSMSTEEIKNLLSKMPTQ